MGDVVERLAEHLYGHSRAKAIEWAKEDKFDSCYRQAEDIIELLGIESMRQQLAESQARNAADGWRQCAKGQRTTQYCGLTEEAIRQAKREALLDSLNLYSPDDTITDYQGKIRSMADELKD